MSELSGWGPVGWLELGAGGTGTWGGAGEMRNDVGFILTALGNPVRWWSPQIPHWSALSQPT